MEAFFTDQRTALRVGVPGLDTEQLEQLFGSRRMVPDGTPVVLDDQMRPVEPLCSWLWDLGRDELKAGTMRSYVGSVLRLQDFMDQRDGDLLTATEADLTDFRAWRKQGSDKPIRQSTWEKESAAFGNWYGWLVRSGYLEQKPWNRAGGRDGLRNGVNREMQVRHLSLDQFQYFRDVGLGGMDADGQVDWRWRGRHPHRNRAAADLALVSGMRLQEWSTLLLPELGIAGDLAVPRRAVEVDLEACAKGERPRTVFVTADAMNSLDNYFLLERAEIVEKAQRTLKGRARRGELFVVDGADAVSGDLHGVLDGRRVSQAVVAMKPALRAQTVLDAGRHLEPLAVFIGRGGAMLTASGWDRVRWRAWERMKEQAVGHAAVLPRRQWRWHDARHTFALQMLIYLTRRLLADEARQEVPMATLLEHMVTNPLLNVQELLGHASPGTTYRYVRYLRNPMKDVEAVFRAWTDSEASYAQIAAQRLGLGDADAGQG